MKTLGQAAFEKWSDGFGIRISKWEHCPKLHNHWNSIAQAAIEAHEAAQNQPITEDWLLAHGFKKWEYIGRKMCYAKSELNFVTQHNGWTDTWYFADTKIPTPANTSELETLMRVLGIQTKGKK